MKKIKQWGKIKLWETSCCGIPMYPAAHKSYSLIKALTETDLSLEDESSDELNKEENQMPEEETVTEAPEEEPKTEEIKEESEKEETKEESEIEEKSEEPKVSSVDSKQMTEVLTKAIVDAIQKAETKRGLSPEENTEKVQETLKKKSLGELAMMQGLFKSDPAIGELPVVN